MAIYGQQTGSLFLGTLRPSTRTYLQRFFHRARGRGYTRFVEPACGAFAMSQLAAKAGFDPHNIEASDVTLTIYAFTGQHIATLITDHQEAGHYEVVWDGSGCSNGVYFCQLDAGGFVETRRMVLLK